MERIADLSLTPATFDAPEAVGLATTLRRAWDIIADQPETEVVLIWDPADVVLLEGSNPREEDVRDVN